MSDYNKLYQVNLTSRKQLLALITGATAKHVGLVEAFYIDWLLELGIGMPQITARWNKVMDEELGTDAFNAKPKLKEFSDEK